VGGEKKGGMSLMVNIDVDRLAEEVMNAYVEFDARLHGKGRFPNRHLKTLLNAVVCYVGATKDEKMIHRSIASALSGLRDILSLQTSRVSDRVIADTNRLECMLFSGYDPHFEGDEPPGL
jgi:hypothetical protein